MTSDFASPCMPTCPWRLFFHEYFQFFWLVGGGGVAVAGVAAVVAVAGTGANAGSFKSALRLGLSLG